MVTRLNAIVGKLLMGAILSVLSLSGSAMADIADRCFNHSVRSFDIDTNGTLSFKLYNSPNTRYAISPDIPGLAQGSIPLLIYSREHTVPLCYKMGEDGKIIALNIGSFQVGNTNRANH